MPVTEDKNKLLGTDLEAFLRKCSKGQLEYIVIEAKETIRAAKALKKLAACILSEKDR